MANNKYKAVTYTVAIELPKPPSEVFKHLINLSKWWPEDFGGENIKLNSEFILSTGYSHYSKNKVIEYIPNEKFAWQATEAIRETDGYDWSGSKMIFKLAPKNDRTLIAFTYDGVVFEDEYDRLVRICDMTLKD